MVINMEAGPCHRVVFVNKKLTSRRLPPLICNNDDILLGVILKLIHSRGRGKGAAYWSISNFLSSFKLQEP